MKKAIVLLSGGLDSAVTFFLAKKDYQCQTLIFDYGQKAIGEVARAKKISEDAGSACHVLNISLPWKGSALLDEARPIPEGSIAGGDTIPDTYVPGRNIIFLSFAVSFAEAFGAEAIFIGAHQLDFSNYPDCRKEFFIDFQKTIQSGTKSGSNGNTIEIKTPILDKTKKEIVEIGKNLNVPFEDTWSCYQDAPTPCGVCESCLFRIQAFKEAGLEDPALKHEIVH